MQLSAGSMGAVSDDVILRVKGGATCWYLSLIPSSPGSVVYISQNFGKISATIQWSQSLSHLSADRNAASDRDHITWSGKAKERGYSQNIFPVNNTETTIFLATR